MLRAMELTKRFGDSLVLDRVSIEVRAGTVTSILGPSGGGKTTLLRMLALLDRPESGAVELHGRESTEQRPTYRGFGRARQNSPWPEVTLVFQQQFLWPHLTLEQNLTLSQRETQRSRNPSTEANVSRRTHAEELLALLELEHLRATLPWQLSQGERARAALARALLLNPKYLLLDEVTAALDSARCELVGQLIRAHANNGGAALLVTHDLAFATRWSDHSFRLEHGRIHATDLDHELLVPTTLSTQTC